MIPDITASDVSWFHYLVIPPILFMLLAAVNTLAGTDQQAELFRAVMSGNIEAIRTALDNGADINTRKAGGGRCASGRNAGSVCCWITRQR